LDPGSTDTQGIAGSPRGSRHAHFIGWLKVGDSGCTLTVERCAAG
jgi:hypothetical protein